MESTLKSQNTPYIAVFILWNAALLYLFAGSLDNANGLISFVSEDWESKISASLLVALVTTAINALISSNSKAVLVFMRKTNPLPGCRAFSLYGPADARVDMKSIQKTYGKLPSSEVDQNALWYKIYKKYQDRPSVTGAHKSWLLLRDMTAIIYVFALASVPVHVLSSTDFRLVLVHAVVTISMFLVIVGAARTSAIAMVTAVLAEESSGTEGK